MGFDTNQYTIINFSFLASGDSYNTLTTRFHLRLSTVHYIIGRTCTIIWNVLSPVHLKLQTMQDLEVIEQKFSAKGNFPNCLDALDGKYIVITAPWNSGSLYFNYKGTFSLVLWVLLMQIIDSFIVDIGDYGSNADGSVFKNSLFGQAFVNGQLNIPPPKPLPQLLCRWTPTTCICG